MLIEYVVFGALVLAGLSASIAGIRRRRRETLLGQQDATFLPHGDGTSASGEIATHHLHTGHDAGFHGGFDSGGSGGHDGSGGGHHH